MIKLEDIITIITIIVIIIIITIIIITIAIATTHASLSGNDIVG